MSAGLNDSKSEAEVPEPNEQNNQGEQEGIQNVPNSVNRAAIDDLRDFLGNQPADEVLHPTELKKGLRKQRWFLSIFLILVVIGTSCLMFDLVFIQNCNRCDSGRQLEGWNKLKSVINNEVFGQHIAVDAILRALYAHVTDPQPKKALVLCFHGWLGSGKTHLSQLIAKYLYHDENIDISKYVKSFIGPRHFLLDSAKLKENQANLVKIVEETVKACGRSLFIFDEVDKMPSEIFDVLLPFMDYHNSVDGVDYRKAIFIFLSNTGGVKINEKLIEFMQENGKTRGDLTLYDFRDIVSNGAFSENGGLFKSEMITKRLVDHYVPFLQLERKHVILCAKKEIQRRNVLYIAPEKIANRVTYRRFELGNRKNSFLDLAVDGCKNIMTHTAYFLHDSADPFNNNAHTEL